MLLISALSRRYPHKTETEIRECLIKICQNYLSSNLGDSNAEQNLVSDSHYRYWQQLSEVLLADQLMRSEICPIHKKEGPDFLIEHEGKRIWIEVITPEPTGIPDEWINNVFGEAFSVPHQEILLRWTSAIKEKTYKCLGDSEKNHSSQGGYLRKGVVGDDDAYVIAVNGRLLRRGPGIFSELLGISQFPYAVEATFCIGPLQIHINRTTLETIGVNHEQRVLIPKPNGSTVPANMFLTPQFGPVSAIWAVDIDEGLALNQPGDMVVVHNPHAINPIPRNFLPAHSEYVAVEEADHYQLSRYKCS